MAKEKEVKSAKKISKTEKPAKKVEKVSKSENPYAKFAIIEIAGTQVKVAEGRMYEIAKQAGAKGDSLTVENVLLISDGDKVTVGTPYIKGAKVEAVIDSQKKDKKIRIFKYKAKSRYRRTYGHRAEITRIAIKKIAS